MPGMGIAIWLVACRNSVGMTEFDLANCVHAKDQFPPTPQAQPSAILAEIVYIEQNDAWTFAGQMLQKFWANAFICLRKADPWARHCLTCNVLDNLP